MSEVDARVTACAARLARAGFSAGDLASLAPVFDPLSLVESGEVEPLRRGLAEVLDDETAAALTDEATGPAVVAARFFALRDHLALLGPLSVARGRR